MFDLFTDMLITWSGNFNLYMFLSLNHIISSVSSPFWFKSLLFLHIRFLSSELALFSKFDSLSKFGAMSRLSNLSGRTRLVTSPWDFPLVPSCFRCLDNPSICLIRRLLDRDANVSATDQDLDTALHYAALAGAIILIWILLDEGTNTVFTIRFILIGRAFLSWLLSKYNDYSYIILWSYISVIFLILRAVLRAPADLSYIRSNPMVILDKSTLQYLENSPVTISSPYNFETLNFFK